MPAVREFAAFRQFKDVGERLGNAHGCRANTHFTEARVVDHQGPALQEKELADGRGVPASPVGFPDLATSIDAAVAIAENGVDVIELGLPYSDPVMDGTSDDADSHTDEHLSWIGVEK